MLARGPAFDARKFLLSASAFVLMTFQTPSLSAQLTRGFISGTVQDPSTAVIANATVTLTNNATNIQRGAATNEIGFYRFVAVEPGSYTIEFASPGFQTTKIVSIHVGTAQEVVLNQTLALSREATTIEVRGTPPGLQLSKTTPTIERTHKGWFVSAVPLTASTRDVTRLALLAPTVVRAPGSNRFSANGQRARNNNFLIDGTDNNDLSVTLPIARVIPEAVFEFQVQTTPYSAEYGRNSGAQVSILTRRGTNAYHGEVWDYVRANWMEPVSLLNKRAGFTETPRFIQNQIGGAISGPVKRDRTFFFGLLEANRQREASDARNAQAAIIPTSAGLAALSAVPLGPDQTLQSRQAVLDALSFLPEVHKNISRYDNLTTQTVNGVPIEIGTIRIPLANPHNFWYAMARFDHQLSENGSLTFRYHLDKQFQPDFVSNKQFGSRFAGANANFSQNYALSHTRSFGSRFINEFRFAYSRRNLDFPENDPKSPTVQIGREFTIGGKSNFPQGRVSNTFQWQNVSTYLRGRHSLKMGADIRRNRLFNRSGFDSKGTWTFNSLSDFINNRASRLRQAVNEATFAARQTNLFWFFQDDVKVTSNLTVNLGIRHEYSGVPFGFFGAANAEVAAVGVPLRARPDKNNWAPRIGVAFSPSPPSGWKRKLFGEGQTVFRAGFGVGYDVLFYNILSATARNYPRVVTSQTFQPETINLFPALAPRQTAIPPLNPLFLFANTPAEIQNPTTNYWSFAIQRQFGRDYTFEIGYTGNRSYHQIRQGDTNPGLLTQEQAQTVIAGGSIPTLQARRLNSAWGPRISTEATALGEYHAMFLRLDKKLSHGLLVGSNYTWSANFSDSDELFPVGDIALSSPAVPQNFFDYKNEWSRSVFDRPNRFVIHYAYEIPWLDSPGANHPVLKHLLAGWSIAGFSEWQSGQPFTITTGVDSGGSGTFFLSPWRPDYNPNGQFSKDPVEGNLRTFRTPITGEGIVVTPLTAGGRPLPNSMPNGGNLGRNTFRGPSFTNWNFSLMKTVSLSERSTVQLRADWINLWNHRNFGNPVAAMNSPAFGSNTTNPGGRSMLLSLKIRF